MARRNMFLLLAGMIIFSLYFLYKIASSLSMMEVVSNIFLLGLVIKIADSNIRLKIYEDTLTFPAMGLGLLANVLIAFNSGADYSIIFQRLGLSIAGILIGGSGLYLVGVLGDFIFKKESMGGGTIKLVAAMGAFVGPFIIWIIPVWLLSGIVFTLIYKAMGTLKNCRTTALVPTAPIDFVALVCLLFIQKKALDPASIVIAVVVLFLGCNCLFDKVKEEKIPRHI